MDILLTVDVPRLEIIVFGVAGFHNSYMPKWSCPSTFLTWPILVVLRYKNIELIKYPNQTLIR